MKPDWKDAPKWAQWLAKDQDNLKWYWHEQMPKFDGDEWISDGFVIEANADEVYPSESLECRP